MSGVGPKTAPPALIRPGGHFWAGRVHKAPDFGGRAGRPKMTTRRESVRPSDPRRHVFWKMARFGASQVKKRTLGAE